MKKILLLICVAFAFQAKAQIPADAYVTAKFTYGALKADLVDNTVSPSKFTASGAQPMTISDRANNANLAINIDSGTSLGIKLNNAYPSIHNSVTSFWIKVPSQKDNSIARLIQAYGNYSRQGVTGYRLECRYTDTTSYLYLRGSSYANGRYRGYASVWAKTIKLDDDQWHHIAIRTTLNPNNDDSVSIETFVDSKQLNQITRWVINSPNVGDFIRDATLTVAPLKNYRGGFDDLRFYKSALTTTEITALYNEVPNQPRIVFVNQNASGANDGTSWANAYQDLRDAFVNVQTADQIWIAKGKYTRGGTNRNTSFGILGDYISVFGGFDGTEDAVFKRDWRKNETIISADIQNDGVATNNAYTAFLGPYAQLAADAIDTCYIDGLIFQDGYANATGSAKYGRFGGGTFIESYVNKITFNNCIWRNNTGINGGGISVSSEFSTKDVKFSNCEFTNNKARAGAQFDFATYGKNQNIEMLSCLVANNQVVRIDGKSGVTGHGGRVQTYNGGQLTVGIANTTWAKNSDTSTVLAAEKVLLAAHKRFGNGIGVMFLENCIFSDNKNDEKNLSYPPVPNNSRINISTSNCLFEDSTSLSNTITKLNTIQGNAKFEDVVNDNFRLAAGSPAIDKGSTNGLNLPSQDLIGNQRVFGNKIDLGCYEFGGASAHIQKAKHETLSLYPNPAKNQINLKLDTTLINSILVLDLSGKVVLQINQVKAINIGALTPGMYVVQAVSTKGTTTGKFIKQ